MSYQVLARKWRPKDFSQLMGQEHVVTVLVNALMQERLHHAYLFTGTRGVGKTTIARIFAKSLNCQQGITATPCGKCDVCIDVDQGNFVDLLEVDAASRTKVDDTREILDNVQYAPTRGRFKVYLIDEVHMLSKSSFNALLKTLEEPPPHVKFILATTDPQKLPVTVLSRCLQFHLKALTPVQIEQKLVEILTAEAVTFDEGALTVIAKAARGSMRDSLSLTDQAIAQGQGHITSANLQSMLGGVDQNWIYKILIALIKQDSQGLLELTQSIASFAPSYHRLLAELLQLLHQVALWQLVPNSVDVDEQRATLLTKFAQSMSPEDVQLYYQIVLNGRKDLPYSFDEQAGFDMVVLRMLAFKPAVYAAANPNTAEALTSAPSVDTAQQFADVDLSVSNPEGAPVESVKQTTVLADESVQDNLLPDKKATAVETPVAAQKADVAESTAVPIETDKVPSRQPSAQPTDILASDEAQQPAIDVSNRPLQRPVPSEDISSLNAEQQQLEQLAQQQFAPIDSYQQDQFEPVSEDDDNSGFNHQFEQSVEPQSSLRTSQQANIQPATAPVATDTTTDSSGANSAQTLEKMLATRNMLRSRKKLSEGGAKKSSGQVTGVTGSSTNKVEKPKAQSPLTALKSEFAAPTHDEQNQQQAQPLANTNDEPQQTEPKVSTAPIVLNDFGDFNADAIDPNEVRFANQVDSWAQIIDAMELGGRVRQLAFNATMDPQSNDSLLKINLNQNSAHINSQSVLDQIKARYANVLNKQVEVEINLVENPGYTPLVIQQIINEKRLANAQQIIHNDKFVKHLIQNFDADIFEESIEPL